MAVQSALLLGVVGVLIAAPGVAASLLAFRPGEAGILTRLAATFGLGFAVAGGCAFVLAAAHVFWLASYLPMWLVVTTVLWIFAIRGTSLHEQAVALRAELTANRVALVLGAAVMLALLVIRGFYLHILPGPRFVYYLNGLEIANSHGIPTSTLEYGQGWPPATDKVFLDAFTGVLPFFNNTSLIGPGVLQWLAYAGAAVGLWASSWELGLRRTGILVPILLIANRRIISNVLTSGFGSYRAEEFGMAVAFCSLALGIVAIRDGGRRHAIAAGVVLGAASGAHLIPTGIVVLMLAFVGLAELLRDSATRTRAAKFLDGIVVVVSAGLIGLAIRLFAGGSFGLTGASNQAAYDIVHTSFDPTAYLLGGRFVPWHNRLGSVFYVSPSHVLSDVTESATGLQVSTTAELLLLAGVLAAALVLFLIARTELGTLAFAAAGLWFGLIIISLYFSYRYRVWVDATFGVRRPVEYAAIGPILLALGLVECALVYLGKLPLRAYGRIASIIAAVLVAAVSIWLIPSAELSSNNRQLTTEQAAFTTWVRTATSCGARFLVDQRSEGTLTALTGRFDLTEGMGPFLRPDRLPYVLNVILGARRFFENPSHNEAFLRRYDIGYVVLAQAGLIGYPGPIPGGNARTVGEAPFLHQVLHTSYIRVYEVDSYHAPPVSPLLRGPYLSCRTRPAHL